MLPDAALPVALELLTPRRGRIVLGRVTLSSEYPMGLWHAWAYVHFPLEGLVFPAPEVSPPPLPFGPGGADSVSQGRGEDADLAGLRDYQRGDSPRETEELLSLKETRCACGAGSRASPTGASESDTNGRLDFGNVNR